MAANAEVIQKEAGIIKWKSDKAAATAKTLGFCEGGLRASWSYNRTPIYNNDGTLSHYKESRKPVVSISVSKFYQDAQTELLSDASNGLNALKTGQTVPTGTLSFECLQADGTTYDVVQFTKATLMSVSRSQGNPDTLELQFTSVGEPTYGSTQLT